MSEKAIEDLKKARSKWLEKQGRLELALLKSANASNQFELEEEIEECKQKYERLQEEIVKRTVELHQSEDSFILNDLKEDSYHLLVQNKQPMNIVWLPRNERVNPCHKISAHLTIAVFQDGQNKQNIRILPELYYDHPENPEIALIPLVVEDNCAKTIANFPNVLQCLVNDVTNKIIRALYKGTKPVQLTIYLFLPVEVLCSSLKQWCGESSNLATRYPVVVGCSDRFNSVNEDRGWLQNQLKEGWERLSESATALRQLKWIQPDESFNGDLVEYAGLQCFGQWLKSGEKYLDRWAKLVEAGIPLALWMCEVEADREAIAQTFDWLTDCDLWEFLQRVPKERRKRSVSVANSGYHLGVFYEDPNYVPIFPEEFSWPQ